MCYSNFRHNTSDLHLSNINVWIIVKCFTLDVVFSGYCLRSESFIHGTISIFRKLTKPISFRKLMKLTRISKLLLKLHRIPSRSLGGEETLFIYCLECVQKPLSIQPSPVVPILGLALSRAAVCISPVSL